jgi:hypothetical protein
VFPYGRFMSVLLSVAVLLVWIAACPASDVGDRPDRIASQGGWVFPYKNPVIKAGDLRRQGLWNDPSPLKENGQYILYMTTSIKEPFKPPIVPFRAVSPDGVKWKLDPEEPIAMPTGTRFVSIETPSVVKFHDQYHMFFSGIYADSKPTVMAIGHAVSPDGVHWKVSPDPVISETGNPKDWDGFAVGEPGAIVRGDQIFVYFCATAARASGRPPQEQTIGLAKTTDGEHFTTPVKVLAQSALYPPEKGFAGYSTPAPFELNGKVHLLYDVALYQAAAHPNWQEVAIHHAVSRTGGEGDFIQDDKPIFTRNDFSLATGGIGAPAALVDGGEVKMWFGGHVPVSALWPLVLRDFSGEEFGIYYASRRAADFH